MKIFVKPVGELDVLKNIKEIGRIESISKNGEYVPDNRFYRRLISRGELVVSAAQSTKKSTTVKAGE